MCTSASWGRRAQRGDLATAGGTATRATHELEDGRQGIGLLELEDGLPGSMKMEKKVRARVHGRLGHSYHVRP